MVHFFYYQDKNFFGSCQLHTQAFLANISNLNLISSSFIIVLASLLAITVLTP